MKAVFFDRDGTLNIDPGYINDPADMKLYKKVPEILQTIKSLGYSIFVVSNQSGIGRGKIKPREYRAVCDEFLNLAGGYDIIDDILYCHHTPESKCSCRKPGTILIDIINNHYKINIKKSYFAGDKMSDIAVGAGAGLKTILILNGIPINEIPHYNEYKDIKPDYIIDSIAGIKDIIKK